MLLFIIIAVLTQYILIIGIGDGRNKALKELFGKRAMMAYIPMWFWIDVIIQSIKVNFGGELE